MNDNQTQEKKDTLKNIGADLRLVPPKPYKDDDNYTKFVVSSDGYYRVDRFFLGLSKEIKKWTKTSYINKYSGERKIKLVKT